MPLHTLGLSSQPRSWYGLTWADLGSLFVAFLFYAQPGIDHKAVFQWIIDWPFFGSVAFCAITGTFVFHKAVEWGGMGLFELFYQLERRCRGTRLQKIISSAKLDTKSPWLADHPDKTVAAKAIDLKKRSIQYIVTFHVCVSIIQAAMIYFATQWKRVDGQLTWSWVPDHPDYVRARPELIPSKVTVAYQCLVSTFIAELGFYLAHRLMHETRLYYWHKRHHEFKETSVYTSFYVGVLDVLLTDLIPAGFCIVWFDMHQWTIWLFTLPLVCNSMRVHGGYDCARLLGFDPSQMLPFCTDTERTHDIHHRTNTSNYGGAYFIMDRLFGTFRSPDDEIAERKAAEAAAATGKGKPQSLKNPSNGAVAPAPVDDSLANAKLKAN